ncbi:MAG TPA: hypothetical protein VNF92_08410 [Gemmatimonadaceae bacterium]|nr:hypothetical protein [Gemmatimonadaceae bacterium]
MMRLWMATYAEPSRLASSAAVSAAVHGGVIFAAIVSTLGAPQRLKEKIAQEVQFLPPPDRMLPARGPTETLHFVLLSPKDNMEFAKPQPSRRAVAALQDAGDGHRPVIVPVKETAWNEDSVASALDVDSTVRRYPESAAPAYPPALLAKHIEGSVATTYIVDTTGLADTASLVIMGATDTGFARSVREALPYMRFRPAIRSNRKVRQLVSQVFLFRILHPAPDTTAIKKSGNE